MTVSHHTTADVWPERASLPAVTAILAAAALVRIAAAVVLPDQGAALPDIESYRESAQSLASAWRMVDPTQMPLYPLLIALAGPGLGQLAADVTLSVVTVWLVYALTFELFADRVAALASGVIAACYLPLVFFAVVGLSETLFIALMLGAFLAWYRGSFLVAAVISVLAVLTRPVFDLAAPLLIVAFALLVHRLSIVETAKRLVAYAAVYVALMAPWWLHNHRLYGSFVRLNPNLGLTLYAGNNPLNRTGGAARGVDYDRTSFDAIRDPVARDRAMRDAAIAYIIEEPGRFLSMAWVKFVRMWRAWPSHESYSNPLVVAASVLSFVPVLLLAAIGLILSRRQLRRLAPILLFGLGYTLLHMALVGTIRYRLPLEAFLICFSGVAISALVQTVARRRVTVRPADGYGG
jgi:4-amino-4-deoxy-L-arabinose transferase-like glycosyltransferase